MENLEKRISELEKQIKGGSSVGKKEKVPRKPSEYNKFVKNFIDTEKKKNKDKSHKELFAEAAKAWSSEKKK